MNLGFASARWILESTTMISTQDPALVTVHVEKPIFRDIELEFWASVAFQEHKEGTLERRRSLVKIRLL